MVLRRFGAGLGLVLGWSSGVGDVWLGKRLAIGWFGVGRASLVHFAWMLGLSLFTS